MLCDRPRTGRLSDSRTESIPRGDDRCGVLMAIFLLDAVPGERTRPITAGLIPPSSGGRGCGGFAAPTDPFSWPHRRLELGSSLPERRLRSTSGTTSRLCGVAAGRPPHKSVRAGRWRDGFEEPAPRSLADGRRDGTNDGRAPAAVRRCPAAVRGATAAQPARQIRAFRGVPPDVQSSFKRSLAQFTAPSRLGDRESPQ
jgi:hypothetical protein